MKRPQKQRRVRRVQPQSRRHLRQQPRPGVPLITRATSFILEQNRLLQRDNAALIKQLARLREELDAVKPKSEKKTAKTPAASQPSSAAKPRTAGKRVAPAKAGKR